MSKTIEEIRIKGTPVSTGVAIGILYMLKSDDACLIPSFNIEPHQISSEIERYKRALNRSREELQILLKCLVEEGASEAVEIINTHLQMLDDPVLAEEIESKITRLLKNTESIFSEVMESYKSVFLNSEDPEIRQRYLDVKDIFSRVLRHLMPDSGFSSSNIPSQSIVCSSQIVPSQTAEASPNQIRAFVTQYGGPTSHAALIAKAKALPYVSNVNISQLEEFGNSNTIVDGFQGLIIVNPTTQSIEEYREINTSRITQIINKKFKSSEEDKTIDGKVIEVQANLENLHDLSLLKELKTNSIGLVRSELLYLKSDIKQFCEQEQYELYKQLMQLSGNMEVTFRIFDIGSDKRILREDHFEPNPALGCRSIRFLMSHPKIFETQIRSALRAARYGKMKLLLPLISDLDELREAKAFIESVKHDLDVEGIDYCRNIPIGCMVEVPAFVIMCDLLVKECDFLSIGTNDLAQYTFAADRSNPKTCERYRFDHPAIVRMISKVVKDAEKEGIDVSICGEIASDPSYTDLLIGLGIKKLSCASRFIPVIKEEISKIEFSQAEKRAKAKYQL